MALTKVKPSNILLTTPAASSNDVTPATTAYVTTAIANLADSAPSTLNCLLYTSTSPRDRTRSRMPSSA